MKDFWVAQNGLIKFNQRYLTEIESQMPLSESLLAKYNRLKEIYNTKGDGLGFAKQLLGKQQMGFRQYLWGRREASALKNDIAYIEQLIDSKDRDSVLYWVVVYEDLCDKFPEFKSSRFSVQKINPFSQYQVTTTTSQHELIRDISVQNDVYIVNDDRLYKNQSLKNKLINFNFLPDFISDDASGRLEIFQKNPQGGYVAKPTLELLILLRFALHENRDTSLKYAVYDYRNSTLKDMTSEVHPKFWFEMQNVSLSRFSSHLDVFYFSPSLNCNPIARVSVFEKPHANENNALATKSTSMVKTFFNLNRIHYHQNENSVKINIFENNFNWSLDGRTSFNDVAFTLNAVKHLDSNKHEVTYDSQTIQQITTRLNPMAFSEVNSKTALLKREYDETRVSLLRLILLYTPHHASVDIFRKACIDYIFLADPNIEHWGKSGVSFNYINEFFKQGFSDKIATFNDFLIKNKHKNDTNLLINQLLFGREYPHSIRRAILSNNFLEASVLAIIDKWLELYGVDKTLNLINLCSDIDNYSQRNSTQFIYFSINWLLKQGYSIRKIINFVHTNGFNDSSIIDIYFMAAIRRHNRFDERYANLDRPQWADSITQYHDYLVNVTSHSEAYNNTKYKNPFMSEFQDVRIGIPSGDAKSSKEYYFKAPKRSFDLTIVGKLMNNCIGNYVAKHYNKECEIILIELNGDIICCLEVDMSSHVNKGRNIVQAKLNYNKPAYLDADVNKAIIKWAVINQLVIRTSDINNRNAK